MKYKEQFDELGFDLIDGSLDRHFLVFRQRMNGALEVYIHINLEVGAFSKQKRFKGSAWDFDSFDEAEARAVLKAFDEYNARKEVK